MNKGVESWMVDRSGGFGIVFTLGMIVLGGETRLKNCWKSFQLQRSYHGRTMEIGSRLCGDNVGLWKCLKDSRFCIRWTF